MSSWKKNHKVVVEWFWNFRKLSSWKKKVFGTVRGSNTLQRDRFLNQISELARSSQLELNSIRVKKSDPSWVNCQPKVTGGKSHKVPLKGDLGGTLTRDFNPMSAAGRVFHTVVEFLPAAKQTGLGETNCLLLSSNKMQKSFKTGQTVQTTMSYVVWVLDSKSEVRSDLWGC